MRWVFCFFWLLTFPLQAQEQRAPYVHHLELGALQGSDDFGIRVNPSLKSLHGVQFHPNHLFGFVLGLDVYPQVAIVPFGMGWRGTMNPEQRTSWMAGMDLGYGSMVMEEKMVTEWNQHTWFEGGLMAHPTAGIRVKNKGNTAWSFLLGYKHQSARFYQGLPVSGNVNPVPNPSNPSDWISFRKDRIKYHNLTFSVGLLFL